MLVNLFPKTLHGLVRQTFPRHRFQPSMQQLISPAEYIRRAQTVPEERHVLSRQEIEKAESFTSRKRQTEWLTGRICAKLAAMHYHNSLAATQPTLQPAKLHVCNNDAGRPCLAGELTSELSSADLSISHGAGYGLALIADCWCGADIEEPRDSLIKVRKKFCSVVEEELLQQNLGDLSELQHMTILWTAKEAAKKALSHTRMPGFLELILTETEAHAGGWVITFIVSSREFTRYPTTITVAAELYQGYGIALCLSGRDHHA